MNCVPLMSEADARLLYHEIDFASGSGALDGMTRTALHRFLSSVHLTAHRRLLIDRVGLYDQVTIECPSGSGRHRELRIVPSAEHGSGRSRLPVLLPAALELLGRGCGETISWNGRCRVLAVYKTFGPERAAKGIDAMKSVCAK